MSIYRRTKTASWTIDIELKDVGRVVVTSETTNHRDARRREGMLRDLREAGQLAVLGAVKRKKLSVGQLIDAKRHGRLNDDALLAELNLDMPLWETMRGTIAGMKGITEGTRAMYGVYARRLARVGPIGEEAEVRHLLDENIDWEALRAQSFASPASWNTLRRTLSRVLTVFLGDQFHPARRQLMRQMPPASEGPGRRTKLSLPVFCQIVRRIEDRYAAAFWTLLFTGMRVGEYLATTPEMLHREVWGVDVPGTKTDLARSRIAVARSAWRWITLGVPAPVGYERLRNVWKEAARAVGHPDLRIHDIRHLASQLAAEGAPIHHAQRLLRHASIKTTSQYTLTDETRSAAEAIGRAVTKHLRKTH